MPVTTHGITIPDTWPKLNLSPSTELTKATNYYNAHPFTPRTDCGLLSNTCDEFEIRNSAFAHAVAGTDCTSAVNWAAGLDVPSIERRGIPIFDPTALAEWEAQVASDYLRWVGEALLLTYDWCHAQFGTTGVSTTLNGAVSIGATTAVVASATNIYLGQQLTFGAEVLGVKNINGTTLTFQTGFTSGHSNGSSVTGSSQKAQFINNMNTWLNNIVTRQWGGATMPSNNYFWGYWRDILEWGITSYQDQPDFAANSSATAEAFLTNAITTRWTNAYIPDTNFPNGQNSGGTYIEGYTDYGRYQGWYAITPCNTMKLLGSDLCGVTQQKWAMQSFLSDVTLTPTIISGPGITTTSASYQVFPWNDTEFFLFGGTTACSGSTGGCYLSDFAAFMAKEFSGIKTGQFAAQYLNQVSNTVDKWLAYMTGDAPAALAFNNLSNTPDHYSAGPKYFYGKKDWNSGSTQFLWQMGGGTNSATGHMHPDWGTMQIARNGRFLLRESTDYTDVRVGYTGTSNGWGITSISRSGTTCTVTTSVPHFLQTGYPAFLIGTSEPLYNVEAPAVTVSDTTHFTFSCNGSGAVSASGGNVQSLSTAEDPISHHVLLFNPSDTTHTNLGYNSWWGGFSYSYRNADANCYRVQSHTDFSYIACDMSGLYSNTTTPDSGHSDRMNPSVNHTEVERVFVRALETVVELYRAVTNTVGGTTAANIVNVLTLHSETNPTLEDAAHTRIDNGTQTLHITHLLSPTVIRVVNEQSCQAQNSSAASGLYRIEIEQSGCANRYILNAYQARANTDANLTASVVDSNPGCNNATTGTFTVTLTPSVGNAWTVVFNKGTTSVGGTVQQAGSSATSLLSSVQSLILNSDGTTTWGGIAAPAVNITPASPRPYDFGSINSGSSSSPVTFTVTNSGNANLVFGAGAITSNASQFTIGSDTCSSQTIAASANCTFTGTFSPNSVAGFSGTLSLADNASDTPQTVAVTGTGVALLTKRQLVHFKRLGTIH